MIPADLNRKQMVKADPVRVKRKPGVALQVTGHKAALALFKKDPIKLLEKSFKDQVEFVKERIIANIPKGQHFNDIKDNLEVNVIRSGNKVVMKTVIKSDQAVRKHEQPDPRLPDNPSEEGGRGPKFVSRVFEKHKDRIAKKAFVSMVREVDKNAKKLKQKKSS